MRKIIFLLVISIFLVSACAQQKPESLVGQGTPVPQPAQEVKQAEEKISVPQQQEQQPQQQEKAEAAQNAALKEFKITAKKWSFNPSVIEVNKGDKVRIIATSIDVSHGFALSEYGINKRLEPNMPTTIEFTADKEGTFTFFCSVFCGEGHGGMNGKLVVR